MRKEYYDMIERKEKRYFTTYLESKGNEDVIEMGENRL
jgi:hypothetical protein